jgi:hypothetical protein
MLRSVMSKTSRTDPPTSNTKGNKIIPNMPNKTVYSTIAAPFCWRGSPVVKADVFLNRLRIGCSLSLLGYLFP